MEPLNIIVKELPNQGWIHEWAPLCIAVLALFVSAYSARLSRRALIRTSRPYVWAMNFGSLDGNGNIQNHPDTFMYCISNSPAKLNKVKIQVFLKSDSGERVRELHEHEEYGTVKYPFDKSQYTYKISSFEEIYEQVSTGTSLFREILIEYSDLGGEESYHYSCTPIFDAQDNCWRHESEKAD